jgi:hypothetical protein
MSIMKIAGVIGMLVTLGAAAPALADECHHGEYGEYQEPYRQAPPVTYYAPSPYVAPPVTYYAPTRYEVPPGTYYTPAPRWHRYRSWGRVGWGWGWRHR